MTSLVAVYLKNLYNDDPVFANAKVVMSLYGTDEFQGTLNTEFGRKVLVDGMTKDQYNVAKPTYSNVMNEGIRYADAVVKGNDKINKDIEKYVKANEVKMVEYNPDEDYVGPILTLY